MENSGFVFSGAEDGAVVCGGLETLTVEVLDTGGPLSNDGVRLEEEECFGGRLSNAGG